MERFNIYYVEASESYTVQHHYPQLLVMRRASYHGRYTLRGVKAIHGYSGVHYAVKPEATSENNADNRNLTFHVQLECAVIYA
jgi:hypothetical protein